MPANVAPAIGGYWYTDHPPQDSDFDSTPEDTTMAVDLENQKLWIRCKGVWVGTQLS